MIGLVCAVTVAAMFRPSELRVRRPAAAVTPAGRQSRRLHGVPLVCAAVAGLIIGGPPVALAGAIVPVTFSRWRVVRQRRSETRRAIASAPDLVELLVGTVRAGMTPLHGLAAITHLVDPAFRDSIALVMRRQHAGERFADALGSLHPALQRLGQALARAERYGEPIAPLLDQLAADARQGRRRASETAARQLPVRLCVPLAVCTLPSFVLLTIVPLLVGAFSSLSGST